MECTDVRKHPSKTRFALPFQLGLVDAEPITLYQQLLSGSLMNNEVYKGIYDDRDILVSVYRAPFDRLQQLVPGILERQHTLSTVQLAPSLFAYWLTGDDNECVVVTDIPTGSDYFFYVHDTLTQGDYDAFFVSLKSVISAILNMTWLQRIKHKRCADMHTIYYNPESNHVMFINFVSSRNLPPKLNNQPVLRSNEGTIFLAEWADADLTDIIYAIDAEATALGKNDIVQSVRLSGLKETEGWNSLISRSIREIKRVDINHIAETLVTVLREGLNVNQKGPSIRPSSPRQLPAPNP